MGRYAKCAEGYSVSSRPSGAICAEQDGTHYHRILHQRRDYGSPPEPVIGVRKRDPVGGDGGLLD